MVKSMISLLFIFMLIMNINITDMNCNKKKGDNEMRKSKRLKNMREEEKRREFLKILTEQAKIKNFEKQRIDFMIKKMKRIPLYSMPGKGIADIEEIKKKISKEYKDYEIIYTGELNKRDIVLIGKRYKYKSCLKWGVLYDATEGKIVKVGEFNDKGQFFYPGKEKEKNPSKLPLFYVVMFQTNMGFRDILAIDTTDINRFIKFNPEYKEDLSIKMDVLIIDMYSESFIYGMGYVWWYNRRSKKWKWLIINTWF